MRLLFQFDPEKARSNLLKHRVSFAESFTVFRDPNAQTFPDELHDAAEQRWITLGVSSFGRLLFVSHQEEGETVRVIGARKATPRERELYEELRQRA